MKVIDLCGGNGNVYVCRLLVKKLVKVCKMSTLEVKPKAAGSPEPEKEMIVDSMEADIKEEPMHVKNTVMCQSIICVIDTPKCYVRFGLCLNSSFVY